MREETMLFYVVDGLETNEELFTTRTEADAYADELDAQGEKARVRICEVNNAYKEKDGWNYEDRSDTFKEVIKLRWHTN